MSKPVFESVFNKELFSARRNRKSFLAFIGAQLAANILGIVLLLTVGNSGADWVGAFGLVLYVLFGVIQFITLCVIGQRIRDIGYSGAWVIGLAVMLAIPLVNIIGAALLVATAIVPGDTDKANKFGASCI